MAVFSLEIMDARTYLNSIFKVLQKKLLLQDFIVSQANS